MQTATSTAPAASVSTGRCLVLQHRQWCAGSGWRRHQQPGVCSWRLRAKCALQLRAPAASSCAPQHHREQGNPATAVTAAQARRVHAVAAATPRQHLCQLVQTRPSLATQRPQPMLVRPASPSRSTSLSSHRAHLPPGAAPASHTARQRAWPALRSSLGPPSGAPRCRRRRPQQPVHASARAAAAHSSWVRRRGQGARSPHSNGMRQRRHLCALVCALPPLSLPADTRLQLLTAQPGAPQTGMPLRKGGSRGGAVHLAPGPLDMAATLGYRPHAIPDELFDRWSCAAAGRAASGQRKHAAAAAARPHVESFESTGGVAGLPRASGIIRAAAANTAGALPRRHSRSSLQAATSAAHATPDTACQQRGCRASASSSRQPSSRAEQRPAVQARRRHATVDDVSVRMCGEACAGTTTPAVPMHSPAPAVVHVSLLCARPDGGQVVRRQPRQDVATQRQHPAPAYIRPMQIIVQQCRVPTVLGCEAGRLAERAAAS
jgi:hypothetical protein